MTYVEVVKKIVYVTSKYNKGQGKAVSIPILKLNNATIISNSDNNNVKIKILHLISFALYYVPSSILDEA